MASRGSTGTGREPTTLEYARSGGQVSRGNYKVRYQHLTDEDLMVLVGGGDADAFAALYDRHCRSAYTRLPAE